ncbi:uncharacterized protein LOC132796706 [Drosophila nasuta]|uniref:uncharacterized protein LOC132796706 n=1 Tax=Drosophila nasuta TaxID=42062 RepID=UPI00295E25DC|nr:uncharacterized protein LOC132796706 [Drosophila nasuta]
MWRFLKCLLWLLVVTKAAAQNNDAEPENICRHCFCQGITVFCNFAHNHTLSNVWNSTYKVPSNIAAMEVQLKHDTQFQLQGGLFRTNRVNRFVVKGAIEDTDQVELSHNAFRNNLAGLPDIQIIGVGHVFVREQAFTGGEIKLTVENSGQLTLYPSAFVNMNMSCNFTKIKSLDIREKAFHPSTNRSTQANVNLHIQQSNIDHINSFDVSMNKIVYVDCTIGVIQRSAFNVTNVKELSFENCNIRRIEAFAFTERLHSEHISITGSQIGTIESEAISGSGISNFTLRQNVIETIKESAIQVYSVYIFIERNTITNLGINWLRIPRGEMVAIEENRFASFAPIQLEQSNRINCSFANNRLGDPQPGSLNFSNCEMRAMTVDRFCDRNCGDNQQWLATLTEHDISSEMYCQLSTSLIKCFNASTVHLRRYEHEACGSDNDRKLQCVDGSKLEWYNGGYVTKEEREQQQRGTTNTRIISISLAIIGGIAAIIFMVAFVWMKCRKQRQQQMCHFSSEEREVLMHDGCRELRSYYQKLTSNKLTSEQCVNIINQVTSQHFERITLSANQVLDRHMQTMHAKCDMGASALLTLPSAPSDYSGGDEHDERVDRENIYTEVPDYSSPQDLLDTQDNFYSEPNHFVGDGHANDMPPPAYAPPFQQPPPPSMHRQHPHHPTHHYQLPSTSSSSSQRRGHEQLPDVLQPSTDNCGAIYAQPVLRLTPNSAPINVSPASKSAALPHGAKNTQQSHVRELRQNLEAMPQFHPNQLTSSRTQNQLQSRFASTPRRQHPSGNASSGNTLNRSYECLDGAASMAAMELMDMRGATALPPDSGSDHSGGSDETVKIDDVIEYADAENCAMLAGKAATRSATATQTSK